MVSCIFSLSELSQGTAAPAKPKPAPAKPKPAPAKPKHLAQSLELSRKMEAQQEQMKDMITNLAQTISNSSSKKEAQREVLAQSEGELDKLKILFLDLALKIVQAVS